MDKSATLSLDMKAWGSYALGGSGEQLKQIVSTNRGTMSVPFLCHLECEWCLKQPSASGSSVFHPKNKMKTCRKNPERVREQKAFVFQKMLLHEKKNKDWVIFSQSLNKLCSLSEKRGS